MFRGKPRRFISGHQNRGIKVYDQMKHKIGAEGITQDIAIELFDYRDGELYWAVSRGAAKSGDLAGGIRERGYRTIGINGTRYYAHRIVYILHHTFCPLYLDHIDGDKSNNDISNLREATKPQNGMNSKKQKSYNGKATSSKYKGVSWHKQHKKWRAQIRINGTRKHIGYFDVEIEAARAYDKVATELFGEFACVNIMEASA